jgi:hypothetical protein
MTDLARLFADADAAAPPEPAVSPGYLESTLARARRSARRRRAVGAAFAALLMMAVAAAVPWPRGRLATEPIGPGTPTRPTFPAEFPAYSPLTASATTSPAGRAIALYEFGSSELFTSWQTLVAGADRDSYRRVDLGVRVAPEPLDPTAARLLSPDGTRVLLFDYPATFVLLDLTTGATTRLDTVTWTTNAEATPRLLAWSPDGHTVAYAVPAPPPADGRAASSYFAGRPILDLAFLDLRDGSTTRVSDSGPVWAAAYSPDGRILALQKGPGHAWLATPDGRRIRDLDLTDDRDLVPEVAFSPDGTLLATLVASSSPNNDRKVEFIDVTGTGRPVPRPVRYDNLLGWRSPTSVVVQAWSDELDAEILAEVSTADGTATVLSRFSRASNCEYGLQRCFAFRIQLASGLLALAGVRPSAPERGPVPIWLELTIAVAAALVAVVTVLLIWTVRRRARRRRRLD